MTKREDGKETRHRLLNAACEVFAEKGYRNARVAEICRRAGANVARHQYLSSEGVVKEQSNFAGGVHANVTAFPAGTVAFTATVSRTGAGHPRSAASRAARSQGAAPEAVLAARYCLCTLLDETVLTLPRGKKKHLATEVELEPEIVAPVAVGDELGTVVLSLDGETVFRGPVVALEAVEPGGFFARLWDMVLMWIARLFAV